MVAIGGAETAFLSKSSEFTLAFLNGVRVAQYSMFCVVGLKNCLAFSFPFYSLAIGIFNLSC